jgi:hypothetical protein
MVGENRDWHQNARDPHWFLAGNGEGDASPLAAQKSLAMPFTSQSP